MVKKKMRMAVKIFWIAFDNRSISLADLIRIGILAPGGSPDPDQNKIV